jgi:hypothetical protein
MLGIILGIFVFAFPIALLLSMAKSPEGRFAMAAAGTIFVLIVFAVLGKAAWIASWLLLWPFSFVAGGVAAVIRSRSDNRRYRRKYSKSKPATPDGGSHPKSKEPEIVNSLAPVAAAPQAAMPAPRPSPSPASVRLEVQPQPSTVNDPLAYRLRDLEARLQKARQQSV